MKKTLASLALVTAALCGAQPAMAAPVYMPTGAQSGVSLSTITGGGWTQCYVGSMAAAIGNNAQNVLSVCTGDYLMMAGRATGSDTFLALAAALRSEAITLTSGSNTHLANGANWYFAPNWSWGFTAAGDSVSNNSCDTSNSPLSMCLHTLDGVGGYRINSIQGLNDATNYQKVFFQANSTEVPEPAGLALAGVALLGLAAARKRKTV